MQSICAPGCPNAYVNDGVCDLDCFNADCEWDGWDCHCAPGCSASMQGDGTCNQECATEDCAFDQDDCIREIVYVGYQAGSDGSGKNIANPASSFTDVLSELSQPLTSVYLLEGIFPLSIPTIISRLQDPLQPLSRRNASEQPTSLLIATLLCTSPNSPIGCSPVCATLQLTSSHIHFSISGELILKDLALDGAVSLKQGCSDCTYCPLLRMWKGVKVDDRGDQQRESDWPEASACEDYKDFVLFMVTGTLKAENVVFQTFRMQPRAIIELQGGRVVLTAVDFISVTPAMTASPSAVVLQRSSYEGGSFLYNSGSVSWLNDRTEYRTDIQLHGFLDVDGLALVQVTDVVFTYNVVSGKGTAALLRVGSVLQLELRQCEFRWNLVRDALLLVSPQRLPVRPYLIREGKLSDTYLLHVHCIRLIAENNYAEIALFRLMYSTDLHTILLEEISLESNTGGSLIHIELAGPLLPGLVSEQALLSNSEVLSSPRSITLHTVTVNFNYCALDLIALVNLPNVAVIDLTMESNQDMSKTGPNDLILPYFRGQNSYLSLDLSVAYTPHCPHGVRISDVINLQIANSEVYDSYCLDGAIDIFITKCTGEVSVSSLTLLGNSGQAANSTGLILQDLNRVTITDLTISSNQNSAEQGSAGLFLSQVVFVSVTESVFEGNVAEQGAALLVQSAQQVVLSYCDFTANSADVGGAIAAIQSLAELNITECTFLRNSAYSHGGALALLSSTSDMMQLVLENTQFSSNMARGNGAALYIAGEMGFASQSWVKDCIFVSNKAVGFGGVYVSYPTGKLAFAGCRFSSNLAAEGSALYIQASTTLKQLTISENSGNSAVFLGSSRTVSVGLVIRNNAGKAVECNEDWSDSSSIYTNNKAGALVLRKGTVSMTQALFLSNLNSEDGGAVIAQDSAIFQCTNCTFQTNISLRKGGALLITREALAILSFVVFSDNRAERGDTAFFLDTYNGDSIIASSSFYGDSFEQHFVLMSASVIFTAFDISAGKIRVLASKLSVKNCTFTNNTELIAEAGSEVNVTNSLITSGHMRVSESALRLLYSSIRQCAGLCISASDKSKVDIQDSTFEQFYSGGVMLSQSNITLSYAKFQAYIGSAIYALDFSYVFLASCSFASGTNAGYGAGLRLVDSLGKADDCTFTNLEAAAGGAIWILANSAAEFNITNSKFTANKAQQGGGLWISRAKMELENTEFTGNQAEEGGAAYFDCETDCALRIKTCKFETNEARKAGGAVRWTQSKPQVDFATMKGNFSPYGPDFASFAKKLIGVSKSGSLLDPLLTSDLPIAITLTEVSSGDAMELTLAVLDHYGNVVRVDNHTECWVKAVDLNLVSLQGVSRVIASLGRCRFTDLRVFARPGFTYLLEAGSARLSSVLVKLDTRNCSIGEEIKDEQCHMCGLGSFSLEAGTTCRPCISGASCYGGATILPKAGYWRASAKSEKVSACLRPSACLGDSEGTQTKNLNGDCEEGYEGKLCGSCAFGYSRSGFASCIQCSKEGISATILALTSLAVAAIVYKAAILQDTELLSWLKLLLSHLQLLLLLTQFNLNWPKQLTHAAQILAQVFLLPEQVFANHCLYQISSDHDPATAFWRRLVATCLFPIFAICCALALWGLRSCWIRSFVLLKKELVTTTLILLFMATPSLAEVLIEAWACVSVQNELWVAANTAVKCHQSLSFVALSTAVIWVFALPILSLCLLCTQRMGRSTSSFLLAGYKPNAYYWELLLYGIKVSVALFAALLPAYPLLQGSCGLLALVVGLCLQLGVKPAATFELQQVGLASFQILLAFLWIALISHFYEGVEWIWISCFWAFTVAFLLFWIARSWRYAKPLLPCLHSKINSDDFSDYIVRQGKNMPIPTRMELCISYLKTSSQASVPNFSPKVKPKAHLYASPPPKKSFKHKRENEVTATEVVLEESKDNLFSKARQKKSLSRYSSEAQAASKGVFGPSILSER